MDWDSSDNECEFEGFTAEDIEGTEIPDAGSDISVSTPPTSDDESMRIHGREIYANQMSEILMTLSGKLLLWKTTNKRKIFLINSFLMS